MPKAKTKTSLHPKTFFSIEDIYSQRSVDKICVFIYVKGFLRSEQKKALDKLEMTAKEFEKINPEYVQIDFDDEDEAETYFNSFLPIAEWENMFYVTLYQNGRLLKK
jgi:hypothetical protein